MIIIEATLFIILVFLSVTTVFFALQIFLSIFATKKTSPALKTNIKTAVLIPAHNEELVIVNTLRDLCSKIDDQTSIVVIADNCSDKTADLARAFDVQVIERHNPDARGKGYAFEFGINHLRENPPDVVVVIDADCQTDDNMVSSIAAKAMALARPVQCLNIMENTGNPSLKQKVSAFAFYVKNYVRPIGLRSLGIPCPLMGTGMAFPWELLSKTDLGNGNIVEDMKLGIDLAARNKGAYFYPAVSVRSTFPTQDDTLRGQRTRWEHGHLQTIFAHAMPLFFKGLITFRPKLSLFALDLAILPLSLLTIMLVLITAVSWGVDFIFTDANYLNWSLFLLLTFILSSSMAWLVHGRNFLAFSELLAIPFYIINKLPIYLSVFVNRKKNWNRTDREE